MIVLSEEGEYIHVPRPGMRFAIPGRECAVGVIYIRSLQIGEDTHRRPNHSRSA